MRTKSTVYKNDSQKEYKLTEAQRSVYREISHQSRLSKQEAIKRVEQQVFKVNQPTYKPEELMPLMECNGFKTLSLFSGGGGLDLGFDRAGYKDVASYELIPICKETLLMNRPDWNVFGGPDEGDVTKVDWRQYKGKVDVIHGGPPCQPFSTAGQQKGRQDDRNMWGEFNRAVNVIKPRAFVAENVLGLLSPKFDGFVKRYILDELSQYSIVRFEMNAASFGVPQARRRVFFVGFRNKKHLKKFVIPEPTHCFERFGSKTIQQSLFSSELEPTVGVRECLGLEPIGYDHLAPTIRSGFTGKRNTTSILNSTAGQKIWGDMKIWPNGVQAGRQEAAAFPAKHEHFRLSVQDVGLLQGFPESWKFAGAVYQVLGQIGNSVCPPVAYKVASNLSKALLS